jgi:hypothetical protein
MKTQISNSIKSFWPIFPIIAALVLAVGCAAPKPVFDRLAGFHMASLEYLDNNKTITDDYRAYIQTLSPEERKFMGPVFYFEDGAGQHAVRIEADINGTDRWYHILFYDKNNKRTKVIKYYAGRYRS